MISWRLLSIAGLLVGLFIFSEPLQAEEVLAGSIYNPAKENEIRQNARRRIYPGGRDEGDLVVQPQLVAPTRKITPKVETATDSGGDE